MIHIAVDAMSGDLGPRVAVWAALRLAQSHPQVQLTLVGDQAQLDALLPGQRPSGIRVHHAPETIAMTENPRAALRRGRDSSMWQALIQVQQNQADVCVSAGNTGALMAMSRFLLKTVDGVERPAICRAIPVIAGNTYMLDLGANVQCSAQQLHQFALMGSVLARTGEARPRIGLLNVGQEAGKGNALVQDADELFSADDRLNYIGFVEADAIFRGVAEVVVCDGFTGNIALKASEGVAQLIRHRLDRCVDAKYRWLRFLHRFVRPSHRCWSQALNPGVYNGAIFLGLRKPVVKSHGAADAFAFQQALEVSIAQAKQSLAERLQQALVSEAQSFY